jgi:hypothetical protein
LGGIYQEDFAVILPPKSCVDAVGQPTCDAERKPKRLAVRTAAIAAGGVGLAYGGVQVGRSANQVRRTGQVAEQAARKHAAAMDNVAAVAGGVRKAAFGLISRTR